MHFVFKLFDGLMDVDRVCYVVGDGALGAIYLIVAYRAYAP